MNRPKIAILTHSMVAGGAERIVSILLNRFENQFETHLLLLADEIDYELPRDQIIHFLDRTSDKTPDAVSVLKIPAIARRLRAYCEQNEIHLVLSLLARPNFVVCYAKKTGLRSKVLISERIYTPQWYREETLRGKIGKWLVSRLYPYADAILPNSHGTANALRHHYGVVNKYIVVKNPVDTEEVARLATEPVTDVNFERFTFVCVAGFRPQKNHRLLINAFAGIESKDSQLLLIGKGELLEETRRQVASMNLQDRVLFVGYCDNPFKYVARSGCFVLSSDFEGFPNALLEALACGLPIVSTDCLTGPRELLADTQIAKHGSTEVEYAKHGLLVPVGDSEMMAHAMGEMMSNDELRNGYKILAAAKAKEYDEKEVTGEFKQIIDLYLPTPF